MITLKGTLERICLGSILLLIICVVGMHFSSQPSGEENRYACTGAGAYVSTYFFTNCLFYRANSGVWQGSPSNQMEFQNCTIWGGLIYLEPTNSLGMTVKDCSLDSGVQAAFGRRIGCAFSDSLEGESLVRKSYSHFFEILKVVKLNRIKIG